MEGNPHSFTVVPPTMFHAYKPRFIGGTSRGSININDQPDNSIGFSRRVIHGSLDLNQPISDSTLIRLDNPSQIPPSREENAVNKTGLEQLLEYINKGGFTELGENEKSVGTDLNPGLSAQEGDRADQVSPQLRSTSGMHSDPKSKEVCAGGGEPREISLIVMGCTHCRLYVMTSEVDPTCPNCDRFALLDEFRGDPAKSMRKM